MTERRALIKISSSSQILAFLSLPDSPRFLNTYVKSSQLILSSQNGPFFLSKSLAKDYPIFLRAAVSEDAFLSAPYFLPSCIIWSKKL